MVALFSLVMIGIQYHSVPCTICTIASTLQALQCTQDLTTMRRVSAILKVRVFHLHVTVRLSIFEAFGELSTGMVKPCFKKWEIFENWNYIVKLYLESGKLCRYTPENEHFESKNAGLVEMNFLFIQMFRLPAVRQSGFCSRISHGRQSLWMVEMLSFTRMMTRMTRTCGSLVCHGSIVV